MAACSLLAQISIPDATEIGRSQCAYFIQRLHSLNSKIPSVPQYPISTAARHGIPYFIADLEEKKKNKLYSKPTPRITHLSGKLRNQTGGGD